MMTTIKRHALALLVAAASALPATAQDSSPPPPIPAIREVSPGMFEIGKIRLDQKAHTITFPGKLNMTEGYLEYLLVTPAGSTHESLLVSEVTPNDVHFAMLLLGAKGAGLSTPAAKDAPSGPIDDSYLKTAPKLKGDDIFISVKWKAGDAEKTAPVEDWLTYNPTKKPAGRGPWIYTGSLFKNGHFLAQSEGMFAALVTNPSALINNPRKGNDDDQAWSVNTKAVPPVDTPLEIIIRLATPPAPDPEKPTTENP